MKRLVSHTLLSALAAVALAALVAACGDDAASGDPVDTRAECQAGTENCICAEAGTCIGDDLFCAGGICRQPTCSIGDVGCACYANFTCNTTGEGTRLMCEDGTCIQPACPQGALGCGCEPDGSCGAGLVCADTSGSLRCEVADCVIGDLDCGCRLDRTCNVDPDTGDRLFCDGNLCVAPECEPGERGCVCNADYSCEAGNRCYPDDFVCSPIDCPPGGQGCACRDDSTCDGELVCGDGTCDEPGCQQGQEGCGCFSDFSCAETLDGSALLCEAGRCTRREVDATGAIGAACYPNGTCNSGGRCQGDVCLPCLLGSIGCGCFGSATCDDGLFCNAGLCYAEDADPIPVPEDLLCYTPCTEGLALADGAYRPCLADGLMAGCLGALSCDDGSCVAEGDTPPACLSDIDCPDFQTCLSGRCYSTCELDTECRAGTSCYRRVCRTPCTASGMSCAFGHFCDTVDGEAGFCMPLRDATGTPMLEVEGDFELSTPIIAFTNNNVSGSFTITNHAPRALAFTVEKVEEVRLGDDGREVTTTNPLFWIEMGEEGAGTTRTPIIELLVDGNGGSRGVDLAGAFNADADVWEGTLRVRSDELGERDIQLTYATRPDGQWSGSIHYFINFNDRELDDWLADPSNASEAEDTKNALLVQWARFRRDPQVTVAELDAIIRSTTNESWSLGSIRDVCEEERGSSAACYLHVSPADDEDSDSVRVFTENRSSIPIPTGRIEMPFAVNLGTTGDDRVYEGRVETELALQYPGNPQASLTFGVDPTTCEAFRSDSCLVDIEAFDVVSVVGGRYLLDPDDGACPTDYLVHGTPWLVPHFTEGTRVDEEAGLRLREECRDARFPDPLGLAEVNLSLAESNPIPDGSPRVRRLELLDGVLVNGNQLVMLVRETFASFLGEGDDTTFAAYGLVVLSRTAADLDDDDFEGAPPPESLPTIERLALSCGDDILDDVLGFGVDLDVGNVSPLARTLLDGVDNSSGALEPVGDGDDDWEVHYLCHDTGRFDGGRDHPDGPEPCPIGSGITYFLVDGEQRNGPVWDHPCQGDEGADRCDIFYDCPAGDGACNITLDCPEGTRGSCAETLSSWDAQGLFDVVVGPVWECTDDQGDRDPERRFCDENRYDLTVGKVFYEPIQDSGGMAVYEPLRAAINNAFRYRTRFRSRSGEGIGFVPDVCEEDSDILPYCYDPGAIEELRARNDCLIHVYTEYPDALDDDIFDRVGEYLEESFSFYYYPELEPGELPSTDRLFFGFERLYAELLIMLGDESYTSALASRFDLAGSAVAAFAGDELEPDGIVLSGGAGYEMFLLYQASQYYQLVLDRFYRLSPTLWDVLRDDELNFITLDSVTTYFNRLILASTNKARVAGEIARRYQGFNEPDLARHVVERMYLQAYLESIAISQFMRRTTSVLNINETSQLEIELQDAQRRYRIALQRMRETYQDISDDLTFFGYAPDYIPFPGLAPTDSNAVEVLLQRARETLSVAREREDRALASTRSFDTDSALFQSELTRVRDQFEDQLAEICGSFEGSDGRIYPAIPKYATLSGITSVLGNACGLLGNGAIFDAVLGVDVARLELRIQLRGIEELLEQVDLERARVSAECAGRLDIATLRFERAGVIITLEDRRRDLQAEISAIERETTELDQLINFYNTTSSLYSAISSGAAACGGTPPNPAACARGLFGAVQAENLLGEVGRLFNSVVDPVGNLQDQIGDQERAISSIRRAADFELELAQCCLDGDPDSCTQPGPILVNSEARVDGLLIGMERSRLGALRAELGVRLALGRVEALRNRADRLIAQQQDAEQNLINIEAARNDPNVRIYRNSEIIDADRSFDDGLRDLYRLTRVYEYYASQSYARLDELFVARMVARGDFNLENYLLDIEDAFNEFEETFGLPDTRVAVISLRDDIFALPELDEQGRPQTQADRIDEFRDLLADVGRLDDRGYLTIPFATSLDLVSPITDNHKVLYVEAEIIGSDIGDQVGRVYLTQRGTGTVRSVEDEPLYFRFPPLSAVLNPFFNGQRVFPPEIYRSDRLRDRPFANTAWELVLNQRDEHVNQDVNLGSLTDVRLYVFYTDFTDL